MKLAMLTALLLLTACIENPEKLLTRQEQSRIDSVELIVLQPRDVFVAGAAGARTIDAAMQRRFELKAEVDRAMATLDFPSVATAALQERVTRLNRAPIQFQGHVIPVWSRQALNAALERSDASAILFVRVISYVDDEGLVLEVYADLFAKSDQLKPFRPKPDDSNPTAPGNALFRQGLRVDVPATGIDYGNPQHLATAIVDATARLAAQLAIRLNSET